MATWWRRVPSTRREPGSFPARRTSNRLAEGAIMHTRTFVLLSVAAVALITLAACSSSSSTAAPASGSSSDSGKITIGSDQANDHGTEDTTGTTTFEIEASNDSSGYLSKPTILQGSAGQSITLEIKNDGSVLHNFSITSMNVNVNIDPGASQ